MRYIISSQLREYISNQSDYFVNDYAANHELREYYENANINFVNIMNQCEVRQL